LVASGKHERRLDPVTLRVVDTELAESRKNVVVLYELCNRFLA